MRQEKKIKKESIIVKPTAKEIQDYGFRSFLFLPIVIGMIVFLLWLFFKGAK